MTITQELINAERVRFEAWWSKVAFSDKHTQYDAQLKGYPHHETQIAWYSWQAAISQHKAVQDGYVLVPKEPTKEMQLEGARKGFISDKRTAGIYKAMLEASPSDNKALPWPHDFSLETVEAVKNAFTKLGISSGDEGLESFSAKLEGHIRTLCREVSRDNKALVESETVAYMDAQGVGTISVKMIKELESRGNVFPYEMWPIKLTATPADTVKQDAPKLCKWVEEDDENMPGTYSGTCGIMWSFTEGGVKENECKYCPSCGGVIEALQAK